MSYFNANSRTELICDENYKSSQLLPEVAPKYSVLDCDHFEVFNMPSFLMRVYDPSIPNWRCLSFSPTTNLYTVNQVDSI